MKNSTAKNNKFPWLPLVLALAVDVALPQAFAADGIRIPAQPLGQALSQLGQQTSLQVFFSPELVAGKQAPAVEGNISRKTHCASCCKAAACNTRSMKVR